MGIDAARLAALQATFAARDVVALDGIFPATLIDALTVAVAETLATRGVRRDLRLAATGDTRRRYRIAGRDVLAETSPLIGWAYRAAETQALVAAIAGEPVVPVPYAPEEFIATRLEEPGDVHDWHWDDYTYALVWVLRAPPAAAGGGVELIRNVGWNKSAPRVAEHVRSKPIERFHPRTGTAYLLRANATMHRVAPLQIPAIRDILCFSYAAQADLGRTISHETIEALSCA